MKRQASCTAVRVLWVGMKIPCLESQSTTTRMAVNPAECKVRADEPRVVGSGRVDGSGREGIGIVYQGLALARESCTPIIGSGIGSFGLSVGALTKWGWTK